MTNENRDWKIFTGTRTPHDDLTRLPAAPPWRPFAPGEQPSSPSPLGSGKAAERDNKLGAAFVPTPPMIDAVNAALYLRRPLLLTGRPGVGKSSLIRAVARELNLGVVLDWSITSRSTLKEGIYEYDALGRLYEKRPIGEFVTLGPLGLAMMESTWPRALLIDEIDKADLDLPNDLLNIFEKGEYTIPELARAKEQVVLARSCQNLPPVEIKEGRIECRQFPFVVLTSNGEREFPAPFLRRCIRLEVPEPSVEELGNIVASHFDDAIRKDATTLIEQFEKRRKDGQLASDQLLNAIFLTHAGVQLGDDRDEKSLQSGILKKLV
jgi:MoxR-like ATPase